MFFIAISLVRSIVRVFMAVYKGSSLQTNSSEKNKHPLHAQAFLEDRHREEVGSGCRLKYAGFSKRYISLLEGTPVRWQDTLPFPWVSTFRKYGVQTFLVGREMSKNLVRMDTTPSSCMIFRSECWWKLQRWLIEILVGLGIPTRSHWARSNILPSSFLGEDHPSKTTFFFGKCGILSYWPGMHEQYSIMIPLHARTQVYLKSFKEFASVVHASTLGGVSDGAVIHPFQWSALVADLIGFSREEGVVRCDCTIFHIPAVNAWDGKDIKRLWYIMISRILQPIDLSESEFSHVFSKNDDKNQFQGTKRYKKFPNLIKSDPETLKIDSLSLVLDPSNFPCEVLLPQLEQVVQPKPWGGRSGNPMLKTWLISWYVQARGWFNMDSWVLRLLCALGRGWYSMV